jgi:hypothetical protein
VAGDVDLGVFIDKAHTGTLITQPN